MASTLRSLTVWIRAKTGDFTRKMRGAKMGMRSFSASARATQASLRQLRGLLLGGMGFFVIVRGIRSAVSAFSEMEKSVSKVSTFMKVTGGTVGMSTKQLRDFAREMRRTTGIAENEILSAVGTLGTFVEIHGEEFKRAIRAAADIEQMMPGASMEKAVIQLGKALQDPLRGLTSLRRVGVAYSDAEVKIIKAARAMGEFQDQQQKTLRPLERQGIQFAAENFLKTGAGQLRAAMSAFTAFKEQVGSQLTPAIVVLTRKFIDLENAGKGVGEKIVAGFAGIAKGIALVIDATRTAIVGLKFLWGTFLKGLAAGMKGLEQLDTIQAKVTGKRMFGGDKAVGGGIGEIFGRGAGDRIVRQSLSTQLRNAGFEASADANKSLDKLLIGRTATEGVEKFFRDVKKELRRQQALLNADDQSGSFFGDLWKRGVRKRQALIDQWAGASDKLFKATRTPMEQYTSAMGDLNKMLDIGAISFELWARGVDKAQESLDKALGVGTAVGKLALPAAVEAGASFTGQAAAFRNNNADNLEQKQVVLLTDAVRELETIASNTGRAAFALVDIP